MGHGKNSSSSSSSSDSDSSKKHKKYGKDKKDKKDKHKVKTGHDKHQVGGHSILPGVHPPSHDKNQPHSSFPPNPMPAQQPHAPSFGFPNAPPQQDFRSGPSPPVASHVPPPAPPPAAGHRIPLSTDSAFPAPGSLPPTALFDAGGPQHPVYIGSAIFGSSVHPCKIAPHLNPPVRVPYGGGEHEHRGRYDLLPIDDQMMEWVLTSHGRIPPGRRPIEGGYEEDGARLFHAIANINGVWVPGKTGEHLGAANVPFGGEQSIPENYQILCWRY